MTYVIILFAGFVSGVLAYSFILALPAKLFMIPVLASAFSFIAPVLAPIAAAVIFIGFGAFLIYSIMKLVTIESFYPKEIWKSVVEYFKSKFGKEAEEKAAVLLAVGGVVLGITVLVGLFDLIVSSIEKHARSSDQLGENTERIANEQTDSFATKALNFIKDKFSRAIDSLRSVVKGAGSELVVKTNSFFEVLSKQDEDVAQAADSRVSFCAPLMKEEQPQQEESLPDNNISSDLNDPKL